jgi:hypothetical protein
MKNSTTRFTYELITTQKKSEGSRSSTKFPQLSTKKHSKLNARNPAVTESTQKARHKSAQQPFLSKPSKKAAFFIF